MDNAVIFYVYDPLCGWCYGFSPVMQQFWKQHRENIHFKVLTGGMITGDKEGPIGKVAPYIKTAYREVEKTTGITFGKPFLENVLEDGSALFSSIPGALAMAVFRYLQPDQVVAFAHAVQEAIYRKGKLPTQPETYGECAEQFGMDAPGFMKRMVEKELLTQVHNEFKMVHEWGITGFPSLVYIKNEQAYLLAQGYTSLDNLNSTLRQIEQKTS